MKQLAETTRITKNALDAATDVVDIVGDVIPEVAPIMAAVGFLFGFIELFLPDENELVLKALNIIEDQVDNIQTDMDYYFNKLMVGLKQDTCFAQYAKYEQKVLAAHTKLNNYLKHRNETLAPVYKQAFLDECSNAQCDNAAQALLSGINGDGAYGFGCDLMQILYTGDVNNNYLVGYKDNVATKGAYLLTLVNMGLTAQSTFVSMTSKDHTAW